MLKKLYVTLPFHEVITQNPTYAKFFKIKIDMGELHPTTIYLKLADRSSRIPRGVLRDVPIKVGKFFIPVNFYVLEMDDGQETPVILGRPLLNTIEAVIRCGEGFIELKIGNEK
ncbi:unnamed protein product [Rhodiola kirilowii]